MHVSLDGFTARPNGEMDWIKVDDEIFELANFFTDQADTALYGRVTWQMMDGYWPTAADQANASKHDKDHSAWYNRVGKVVLSNSMQGKIADKTSFVGGDVVTEIRKLKEGRGKNIMIFGSPGAVRTLMKHNLVDEYWLFVNPIILGSGISMFTAMDRPVELVHKTTKVFGCGVAALHYVTTDK